MHLEVAAPQTLTMHTRDGVALDADVYRPVAPGEWPVLLMRQPYGRRIASTVCYAHPAWYAANGFIVVIQDVRGRGTSLGQFSPFATEASDGADAIAWASTLPGSNGAVGMYGFSYQGSNQLLAAAQLPSALKAIAPAMLGWDLPRDWLCENDAFATGANIEWAIQLAAANAARAGDYAARTALAAAARTLPVHDAVAGRPEVLHKALAHTHYFEWLDQPAQSPYWSQRSPHVHAGKLVGRGAPALFIGGWFDTHLRGTIAAYRAYAAAGREETRLIVGPWAHFPWGRRLGTIDFGPQAISHIDRLQVQWFDRWLRNDVTGAVGTSPVQLFDLGARCWRDLAAWPQLGPALYLDSTGQASLDERDGSLGAQPPDREAIDHLVHDPWRPVVAAGGAWASPPGPIDRTALDARSDVLTYTTAPLQQELLIAGGCTASLQVRSDAASFDLHCVLSSVDESGTATALVEGYQHFPVAPREGPAIVSLRPTCLTLARGARLRLSIAAAWFPAFAVNPGDGVRSSDAVAGTHRVITLALHHGPSAVSRLTFSEPG